MLLQGINENLARSYQFYRKCFANKNYVGVTPKEYGMSIQGKHKNKKRGRNNGKRI